MNKISFPLVFLAGILSFASPCVLPLLPGYVSFVTGISPEQKPKNFAQTLIPLILFVAGFTLVFTALGASATIIGSFLKANRFWLTKVAGLFIIIFGLHLVGVLRLKFLNTSNQEALQKAGGSSSFIMGLAFAIGWTPCIGPILGSVLLYASTAQTASLGSIMLLVYSLGLGIPFIVFGQSFAVAKYRSNWLRNNAHILNKVGGGLMLLMGVSLFTDRLSLIALYLQKLLPKGWLFF